MSDAAILAEGLTKKFGDFLAVDRVSFAVRKGEIFGFLGANGAGKSTTIRMLCGLLEPTAGSARVAGYDINTQTELVIQRALARLLKDRTSFVIAHRLSTITNADRILVIEGGRIVEQGTHAQLLQAQGVYYQLYKTGFQEE